MHEKCGRSFVVNKNFLLECKCFGAELDWINVISFPAVKLLKLEIEFRFKPFHSGKIFLFGISKEIL